MREPTAQDLLAERIRALLPTVGVEEKRMFGTHAFMVAGALRVAARTDGALLIRTEPDAETELTAQPHVARAEMSGRTMGRGWLAVAPAGVKTDGELARWVHRAVSGDAAPAS